MFLSKGIWAIALGCVLGYLGGICQTASAQWPASALSEQPGEISLNLSPNPSPSLPNAPEVSQLVPASNATAAQPVPMPESASVFSSQRARNFTPFTPQSDSDLESGPAFEFLSSELATPDFAPLQDSGLIVSAPQGGRLELNGLFAVMDRPAPFTRPYTPTDERFHVKAMLLQSLAFQSVENVYRLITDPNMRHLTAGKPYWHDYIASLEQWNMRRWWDGDDFLVDYIGHPMEGGVASFIEIQNSPRQRALEFGMNREYWRSRFLGMLWATVYSTQQKIGPMGEAALGSDGGITYPLNCPYPCKTFKPGVTKYTNNTGWTDFIATPVIGSVWVVLEDFIDREVSDRIQHGDMDAVFPKIVRGALNPCRTMANAMRGRKPWYRDFQPEASDPRLIPVVHFYPGDQEVVERAPRYELFPHFAELFLPVNTPTCTNCRRWVHGPGLGAAIRISKWVDFDSDVTYASNASPLPSDRAGGNMTSATFGFRSGVEYKYFSLKAAIRPGFVSYDKAYESSPSATNPMPNVGRITHFATALAINGDYKINSHLSLRMVVDNTAVRYREAYATPPGIGYPPYLSWISHQNFLTNENWGYKSGAVIRF